MSDRKITHEVKLQKSVIIILGVLAVGVMANAFAPAFSIKEAMAEWHNAPNIVHSGSILIDCHGCK